MIVLGNINFIIKNFKHRRKHSMSFSNDTKNEILEYCNRDLPNDDWYESTFDFIKDEDLKDRIIREFKSVRFAYKLYEGISAEDENLVFQIRNQILAYASIYEAVIENVLLTYYSNSPEYNDLIHHIVPVQVSIPNNKTETLEKLLSHNGEKIIPYTRKRKTKDKSQIRFDDKCDTAYKIGLIPPIEKPNGEIVDLCEEIKEIYSFRNGIHLIAEQRKGIEYELELSKKAYRRMNPFIERIKNKLIRDGKYSLK